ncbi:MAG TPA: hypothetical protein VN228_20355 [Pyrinomonadaceae bacterium]|nr:hypothetical protein [Pyrinomonadaceae bacterium]
MAYLVIPHGVTADTATVWVGALNEGLGQARLALTPPAPLPPLPLPGRWAAQDGSYTLEYARYSFAALEPRREYRAELFVGDARRGEATFTTLPGALPALDAKPFTVMLGSCFCERNDESGKLGNTFFNLPEGERPDIKLWCGDQVYLDAPWYHYSVHTHTRAELEVRHFENYWRAWSQSGTAAGFNEALRRGANYFTADDHEFWNNAPNWATAIRDSWRQEGRDDWWSVARSLFDAFQSDFSSGSAVVEFSVPPLSFFFADTRVNRTPDLRQFMLDSDLERLRGWVANLRGPGVLTLGQPLFAEKAGFWGKFTDRHLPDYKQFEELARIIAGSRHSVVMLTGDVHYGRIASVQLGSGAELIEVISSPTALVDEKVGRKWSRPPGKYPSFEVQGAPSGEIVVEEAYTLVDDHFLTVEFADAGARVRMDIKAWPVIKPGERPRSQHIHRRFIQ